METSIVFPADHETLRHKEQAGLHPFSAFNSNTFRMRPLAVIVAAADRDGAIGRSGGMIWHLPADLRHFKTLTMGHAVIMGRRTWESLPKGALPGRRNIVVTRDSSYPLPGAERAASLEEAVALCDNDPLPFIIGGGEIYRQSMPIATRLYLTRIMAEATDSDTFFPMPSEKEWSLTEESPVEKTAEGIEYKFQTYTRR